VNSALWLPLFDELADPLAVVRVAAEAEGGGWHGVFIWDHLRWRAPVRRAGDPGMTLAAIATATERMRLGPMVMPLPRRRPAKVARENVTLDRLSRGRLTLGVAIGSDRFKTKTSRRCVDLDPTTLDVLQAWRSMQAAEYAAVGVDDPGWMFTRPDGNPVHPHSFSQAFERVARRAAVPVIRLHDLRHTNGTPLIAAVPVKVVSERLGHASPTFMMETYHRRSEAMRSGASTSRRQRRLMRLFADVSVLYVAELLISAWDRFGAHLSAREAFELFAGNSRMRGSGPARSTQSPLNRPSPKQVATEVEVEGAQDVRLIVANQAGASLSLAAMAAIVAATRLALRASPVRPSCIWFIT
jgi:hypothetical protein